MTLMLWDTIQEDPLIQRYEHHTEFVVGLDFNMFIEGQLASCCMFNDSLFLGKKKNSNIFAAWDETVAFWMIGQHP